MQKCVNRSVSPSCNYRIPLFCDSQYITGQLDHSYTKGGWGGGALGFSGFCIFALHCSLRFFSFF